MVAVGAVALAAGCNSANDRDGTGDAPVGRADPSPADIINMPDGWPNIATKCDVYQPGKRIYVPSHKNNDVQPVLVDDPSCGSAGAPGSVPPTTSTSTTGTGLR